MVSHFRSIPLGELPPPLPLGCFGRGGLIKEIVGLVDNLESVALIGAGGVGKTSVALTVLHHYRIEKRFGENRLFIRCDQFPASRPHFLARLSKAIGAGVENPEDLTLLRPFLSSNETLIILDNAESILDPQGTGAREIYSVMDELHQFKNISLLLTSRITAVPPYCKRPEIPKLSMEAACDIFYNIYGNCGESGTINYLLHRLDFHALSITLLATAAAHNGWDHDRLAQEWDAQWAQVLQTVCDESLAATIELSLACTTFLSLGTNTRDLLEVIAFFPQGIDEKNLDWLFPTISNTQHLFDTFCLLSLTHRSNGFVTMLAPIRDYFGPQDPRASPLLCVTRDRYFHRLSIGADPESPGRGETRWVVSEDVNIEHLLDVFTSIDPNLGDVWDACYHFMIHLYWNKPRKTTLMSKIEALADDHPSKPKCLSQIAFLFESVGNFTEEERVMTRVLELERQWGDDAQVAAALRYLSDADLLLHLYGEGIQRAEEALEISEQIGDPIGQARCLRSLAQALLEGGQPDAARSAASHAVNLITENHQEYLLSVLHQILGRAHQSEGEKEEAIHHFETALRIASPFNWHDLLFWTHYNLAELFGDGGKLDDQNAHIEQAKSRAVGDSMQYPLGRAMEMQAEVWYRQLRLEDAKSEALNSLEIYEKIGATEGVRSSGYLLQKIDRAMKERSTRSRCASRNITISQIH